MSCLERARKNSAAILTALAETGQASVAESLGCSEAHISKLKSDRLDEFCDLLALCGLKVVPDNHKSYPPEYVKSLRYFAQQFINGDEVEGEGD